MEKYFSIYRSIFHTYTKYMYYLVNEFILFSSVLQILHLIYNFSKKKTCLSKLWKTELINFCFHKYCCKKNALRKMYNLLVIFGSLYCWFPIDLGFLFSKNWVFATNTDFLIPISLQPNVLDISIYSSMIDQIILVWNNKDSSACKDIGIQKFQFEAKTISFHLIKFLICVFNMFLQILVKL